VKGRIELRGKGGRIRKHVIDDLKQMIGYWKFKEGALECTLRLRRDALKSDRGIMKSIVNTLCFLYS
jgi:hypothetical protein